MQIIVPELTQNIYDTFIQLLKVKDVEYANPSWDFGNSRTIYFDLEQPEEHYFGGRIRYRFWAEASDLKEEVDEVNDYCDEDYFNNDNIDFNKSMFIRANSELLINPKYKNELGEFIEQWNKDNNILRAIKRQHTALLAEYVNLEELSSENMDAEKLFNELFTKRMEKINSFFATLYKNKFLIKREEFLNDYEDFGVINYLKELSNNHIILLSNVIDDCVDGKFAYTFASKARLVFFNLNHNEIKIRINIENFQEESISLDENTISKIKDFFQRHKDL